MFKKIFSCICVFTVLGSVAFAGSNTVIKKYHHTTPVMEHQISELGKQIHMTHEEIYEWMDRGLSSDDVKKCYIITVLSQKEQKEVADIYIQENNDLSLTLKDFGIKHDVYEDEYNKTFDKKFIPNPRDKIPWRVAPFDWSLD